MSNFKRTLRIAIRDMGGVLGRPRRGLPDNPRYLPPGRYVRDVRDGDVLVLCSADAPLNLTVVPGRHPDDDGAWLGTSNERGENDPEYALVRGASAGAGGLVGSVVVDMRGRWATLRSPAAGDRYLLVDELARARDFERLESTGRRGGASSSARGDRNLMGLRFRERRRARRSACWGVEHLGEGDRAIVILRNRETPELCLRAVGPHPRTKSAAAVVLADFLREELASQMETRARLLALERSIDVERDVALEKLVAIRREHLAKSRALVHARRREGMLDAEQFLDGLTGVVDALRDQVKGASAEPFNAGSGGTRGNARGGNARGARGALGFGIDDDDDDDDEEEAAGASPQSDDAASHRAKHRGPNRPSSGRSKPPPTAAPTEGWRVDADHLARVSKCWDLDVVEFRERLRERDIDDDAVASLQEAIRESAYEHFVVTGMRRYLLNRDGAGDGWEGGGFGEDSEDEDDAVDDDASMMTGSIVSSPGSRSVVSRISSGDNLAKRAKAEERRERRAARRAALRARIRAGGAAVDFRRFKVGSLRDQLERSGVDSGPLAMLVHSLAHAMREGRPKKRRGGFLGRLARNILRGSDSSDDDEQTKEKRGDAAAGGRAKKPPSETEDDGDAMDGDSFVRSGETFRTVLAQEKLSTLSGFVRAEERVRGEHATTYEHRAPVAAGSLDAARVRRDALRAAAAAAANAARDLRANPSHDPETAAVVNFVGGLSLDDLRQELEGHSLLARGLDECVEALLETEWVGGVDGYVERRGERERALRHITVDAFRKRLERHGLEGSMLELNLVTNALARTLVDEGAARVANAEKRRLSSGAALTNASPRQPKTPRPTRIAGS